MTIAERAGRLPTGALLALAGGYLDAYTYVGHGHVFANTMTGNVVLLAIGLLREDWVLAGGHLAPLLPFAVGIWVAQWIRLRGFRDPYITVLVLEMGILAGLSFMPNGTRDLWITTSVAFAASLQVQTFRTVAGYNYSSTYTTGNLRSLSEALFDRLTHPTGRVEAKAKARVFGAICLGFFGGAALGGWVTARVGNPALWVEVGILGVVSAYLLRGR